MGRSRAATRVCEGAHYSANGPLNVKRATAIVRTWSVVSRPAARRRSARGRRCVGNRAGRVIDSCCGTGPVGGGERSLAIANKAWYVQESP